MSVICHPHRDKLPLSMLALLQGLPHVHVFFLAIAYPHLFFFLTSKRDQFNVLKDGLYLVLLILPFAFSFWQDCELNIRPHAYEASAPSLSHKPSPHLIHFYSCLIVSFLYFLGVFPKHNTSELSFKGPLTLWYNHWSSSIFPTALFSLHFSSFDIQYFHYILCECPS